MSTIDENAVREIALLTEQVELLRVLASKKCRDLKSELGQFLTPLPTSRLMASTVTCRQKTARVLDPGAGTGSLFVAVVEHLCCLESPPEQIEVVAFEIDQTMREFLEESVSLCSVYCDRVGISFKAKVYYSDFIEAVVNSTESSLFSESIGLFDIAIQNPPYFKIQSKSKTRQLIARLGVETTNIYTGFLAASVQLLGPEGQLIAITPRSFFNGTYFRDFRKWFLDRMAIERVHTFDSRKDAFKEDAVLQETVIFKAVRDGKRGDVAITSSSSPADPETLLQYVHYDDVIYPGDSDFFIRIQSDSLAQLIAKKFEALESTLFELGIQVSTGRVVDFRVKDFLSNCPEPPCLPLVYPAHMKHFSIEWPKQDFKKYNYIVDAPETQSQLLPNGNYVLVKRFSAKEEKRRLVASVLKSEDLPAKRIGIENHVNYFHYNQQGLDIELAAGLAAFINSSIADQFFRQFSGHTQVNATDLRNMRYPSAIQLRNIGIRIKDLEWNQDLIDKTINDEVFSVSDDIDPIQASKKIEEALEILKSIGLPRQQINERSALTLLSLVGLQPDQAWSESTSPLMGITPMMEFFATFYGKRYAPNSRETVRRQTIHQFMDAAIVVANPDKPDRPVNSPKAVYQIESGFIAVLKAYGTKGWAKQLNAFLASTETLMQKYAEERAMAMLPVEIAEGTELQLSPGGQNVLVQQIITEFAPRFAPGGKVIYVGDTESKYAYFDSDALRGLGVVLEKHGKMPDVIIYYEAKNWLLLIEAVTSHGPVDAKRKNELKKMFSKSSAGLVFVTTFLTRKTMIEYLQDISWETEVWVADSPTHMIHFNGQRFLGPY